MKQTIPYIVIFILGFFAALFFIKGCESVPEIPNQINTDSIATKAYDKGYEYAKLEEIGKIKDSIRVEYVDRWHKYKQSVVHDTLLIECVTTCDSALNAQQNYIVNLETVSSHKDTAITLWRNAYRADSTNVSTLVAVNESLQPRQTFYIGCDATTNGNVYPSIGFDTRKWQFNAGYDPFNKSVKVGAYFKIKGWKRR